MPATDDFARLLAAKLGQARPGGGDPTAPPNTIRTSSVEAWEETLHPGFVPTGGAAYTGAAPVRVRRGPSRLTTLSRAQRDALTALRRLGAPLSDDFDARQLKDAFRRLALDLHPDRHVGVGPQRREWLARRFAVLCEAYRTLEAPQPPGRQR